MKEKVGANIGAVYWAITTTATVGYGDFVPTSNMERCYVFSKSELERIFSNSNFFDVFSNINLSNFLTFGFGKSFSEKLDNFRCEISGNSRI